MHLAPEAVPVNAISGKADQNKAAGDYAQDGPDWGACIRKGPNKGLSCHVIGTRLQPARPRDEALQILLDKPYQHDPHAIRAPGCILQLRQDRAVRDA